MELSIGLSGLDIPEASVNSDLLLQSLLSELLHMLSLKCRAGLFDQEISWRMNVLLSKYKKYIQLKCRLREVQRYRPNVAAAIRCSPHPGLSGGKTGCRALMRQNDDNYSVRLVADAQIKSAHDALLSAERSRANCAPYSALLIRCTVSV